MSRLCGRLATCGLMLLVAIESHGFQAKKPDEKGTKTPADLNKLSLEVTALQTLSDLDITSAQHQLLSRLAKEIGAKPGKHEAGRASEKFRKVLGELRVALAKGEADKIDSLLLELDKLYDSDKQLKLDDHTEVTDAARKKVPELMKALSVRQVGDLLTSYEENLDDPLEMIFAALADGAGAKGEVWNGIRELVVEEVAWKVAGLDTAAWKKTHERLDVLLDKAHQLSPAEFQKQRAQLEAAFRQLVGGVGPIEQIKHVMEHRLAELLSNPELPAALATWAEYRKD